MKDRNETLQQYVSDMLAVERHIHEAVERQLGEDHVVENAQAKAMIQQIEQTTRSHVSGLEGHLRSIGGNPDSTVKDTVTSLLGKAAGVVDNLRDNRVSNELRDDYTALNLAAVSYTMLHTTGLALFDEATANLAQRYLEDLTPLITGLNETVPHVVAAELKEFVENANPNVGEQAVKNTQGAWSSEKSHAGHPHG